MVAICLPLCGAVAILDEIHQRTLASRTGSPRDVAYDVLGAAVGLVVGGLVWRRG
jgi:VanZ family protein